MPVLHVAQVSCCQQDNGSSGCIAHVQSGRQVLALLVLSSLAPAVACPQWQQQQHQQQPASVSRLAPCQAAVSGLVGRHSTGSRHSFWHHWRCADLVLQHARRPTSPCSWLMLLQCVHRTWWLVLCRLDALSPVHATTRKIAWQQPWDGILPCRLCCQVHHIAATTRAIFSHMPSGHLLHVVLRTA